jgi:hypothetical protein
MTPNDKPKKTIDERLDRLVERHEALSQSVESLTHDIHQMQAQQERFDKRERKAREALLSGIAAYLRALQQEPEEGEQQR